MPSLQQQAKDRFNKAATQDQLPTWWPIFSVAVILIVLLFGIGSNLFKGKPTTQTTLPAITGPTILAGSSTTTAPVTTAAPTTTTPPANLAQIADAAALYLYTANSANLVWLIPTPAVTQLFPSAQVVSTQLLASTATSASYQVTVNVSPPNVNLHYVGVSLTYESGEWRVSGDA